MNRRILFAAAALAGLTLGAGAAHALTPRVISVPTAQAPRSAQRPEGTKISCNRPGGAQADACPVIQLGDYTVWAFSYRNNSYGFELAAYRGDQLVGHRGVGGSRYLEGAQVNRGAQTVDFIGQGGRKATVSFADLERLIGSRQ
ncbi:MAG: hypothetical protein KC613_25595, partial [Myxococcales bacterium]|nr:hypothetical protein [Myxococcales bacterium]